MPKGVYPHTHIVPKVYPPEMVKHVRALYHDEGMSQVEVAAELGVTLKVVYRLMVNHRIPRRPRIKRDQRGEKNGTWRGAAAEYEGLHRRVGIARGKPQHCAACDKSDPGRFEWANLTGAYEDITDYIRLCVPCHRKLDKRRREVLGGRTSPLRGIAAKRGGDAACPKIA